MFSRSCDWRILQLHKTEMGLYDRDYMRRDERTSKRSDGRTSKGSDDSGFSKDNGVYWVVSFVIALVVVIAIVAQGGRESAEEREMAAQAEQQWQTIMEQNRIEAVELNSATFRQLLQLPYVDPEIAKKIVEARPFSKVDDLLEVRGIGKVMLREIREYAYVEAP